MNTFSQRRLFLFLFGVVVLSTFFVCSNEYKVDRDTLFNSIEARILTDFESQVETAKLLKKIPFYLNNYDSKTGSFYDINYKASNRTNWEPLEHILRLYDLTYVYTIKSEENFYFQDIAIFNIIAKGLTFWCIEQPHSDNWWYNEIGEPQKVALLLLQLRRGKEKLNKEIENKLIERLTTKGGDPRNWTGANKTDIALHWLYRACLTKDRDLLGTALSEGYSPLMFAPFKEGIQPDYSYFQHGTQLYMGGYGDAFLNGVLKFAYYAMNTEYALDKKQLAMIRDFTFNSYFRVIRGKYMHMNVMGRSMSRKNATMRNSDFAERLMLIDPQNFSLYKTIVDRIKGFVSLKEGVKPNNTTYYIGDYVAHVRPEYAVGVRTVSSRTMRNENGNEENHFTYFLSDGSMHFTQDGDEYYNIFPVWDWSRIPGVTNPYFARNEIPKQAKKWRTPGTQHFVGGASDSLYSVNTYRLDDKYAGINTSAYKSWFFFDDEVVCLGTCITSESELPINTTIEQNRLKGDVIICDVKNREKVLEFNKEYHFNHTLKWVLHNNRGYYLPQGGNILLKGEKKRGRWFDINETQSKEEVTDSVFTLWFDHGKKPLGQKYAYIIVPNKGTAKEMEAYEVGNIQICENSDSIQAVYHRKLDILEIVFLRESTFNFKDLEITTDKPVAMIVKDLGSNKITLHVADPSQLKEMISISVLCPSMLSKPQLVPVDLRNSGVYAGKTNYYVINKE